MVLGLAAQQAAERRAAEQRQAELDQWQRTEARREANRQTLDRVERESWERSRRRAAQVVKTDESIPAGSFLHQEITRACWKAADAGVPRWMLPQWRADSQDEYFQKLENVVFAVTHGNVVTVKDSSAMWNPHRSERISKSGTFSTDQDERLHTLLHEIGHAARNAMLGDDAGRPFDWNQEQRAVAKLVSEYATESASEFAAELAAGLILGKSYDLEVLRLGKSINAWMPPAVSANLPRPVTITAMRQTPNGTRVEFSEPVDPVTADASSFMVVAETHLEDRPPGEDPVKVVNHTVEFADDLRSAIVRFDAPEQDQLGNRLVYRITCPGLRPAHQEPPKAIGKSDSAPIIHVHLPEQQPPVVNVAAPSVSVSPTLSVPPRSTRTSVKRDERGRIIETSAEEKDAE